MAEYDKVFDMISDALNRDKFPDYATALYDMIDIIAVFRSIDQQGFATTTDGITARFFEDYGFKVKELNHCRLITMS